MSDFAKWKKNRDYTGDLILDLYIICMAFQLNITIVCFCPSVYAIDGKAKEIQKEQSLG